MREHVVRNKKYHNTRNNHYRSSILLPCPRNIVKQVIGYNVRIKIVYLLKSKSTDRTKTFVRCFKIMIRKASLIMSKHLHFGTFRKR